MNIEHATRFPACRATIVLGMAFVLNSVVAQPALYRYDLTGNLTNESILISEAPSITTQPQPQLIESNALVTLSVVATGSAFSYQWFSNGIPIVGATGDSLVLTGMPLVDSTNFSVIVSNASGVVTSTPAALWADLNGNGIPDWWEMKYFGNLNQTAGGDFDGDGVNNLDEYREGTDPTNPNSFNPRLHLAAGSGTVVVSPAQPYYTMGQTVTLTAIASPPLYFLGWSGSNSSTTTPLILTMNGHKQITANWINTSLGASAGPWTNHFNSASDADSWVYWFGLWPDYFGIDGFSLWTDPTMDAQTNSNSGSLVFYSPFGEAPSPGTTDQNAAVGTFSGNEFDPSVQIPANAISGLAFDIHVGPGGLVNSGTTLTLSPAGDLGAITIALVDPAFNGHDFAAFSPLTIPAAATNGWVHMVDTNAQDFANFAQFSSQAVGVGFNYNNYSNDYPTNDVEMWIDNVTVVTRAPIIVTQPLSQTASVGGSASFSVVAQGTAVQAAPLTYAWTFNGTNLSDSSVFYGASTATLTLSNISLGNAGRYQVTVTNLFGSVQSSSATLFVVQLVTPVFTSQSIIRTPGGLQLHFSAQSGQTYHVLITTNPKLPLNQWTVLTNGTFGSGAATVTDTATNLQARFYRIVSP